MSIHSLYSSHPLVESIIATLANANVNAKIEGLVGSSKALVSSLVYSKTSTTHLVVLQEKEDAAFFYNDISSIVGTESVLFFPSTYKRSVQYGQNDPANIVLRTGVLNVLSSGKRKNIIVTYPEAIMEKVISKNDLKSNTFTIAVGDKLSSDFIEEIFQEYGFDRVDFVGEPGQYSVRGSIVDIFSYSADQPYRLDFFGDEVSSIRTFSTENQLSVELKTKISIIPNIQDVTTEKLDHSFFNFLPQSSVVWFDNQTYIADKIDNIYTQTLLGKSEEENSSLRELIITGRRLLEECSKYRIIEFGNNSSFHSDTVFTFHTEPQPAFNKNFNLLADTIVNNIAEGYNTFIISENQSQIDRLNDIFEELNPNVLFQSSILNLHNGFTDNDLKVSVFTDHQIFDRYHKFKIRGLFTKKESLSIKELTGLNPGDYVVHIDHGIGRFGGLEKIEVNGKTQEAIKLVFKDNDILYVGIHALHKISKYKGKDGTEPKIYKLGSGAWQKLKQTTKSRVKDIAKELIVLYAKRMAADGFAFSPDSYLQRQLEASFIYEDTPDQLKASEAVKRDMETAHPMDRLVCGDVGFGKTEVAMRAAFKAVCDSKQVAVLVPTTILALQHYKTFSERLKDFPCKIEYISRHRKPADQKKILSDLTEGKIDILIGTNKIVGKEVKFKDLGLLIIDEEQRFGVAVKDKLKKLKAGVDTLTLTATPIPRTLQFSLMGARDLSIINTPPPNRMPIITELHGFNDEIIKEAIEYEVSRSGQVFFIHNRIDNIKELEATLHRICPNIKTAVVHGQMQGNDIENIMFDFIQGDYDVLLATTIIESGLDIPNVNTIIINEANHFGLSDLHQLRGRVGRSNKKAFCYLLAPPLTTVTPEARRRLKAIEEFCELGSGFNIAMQDLDIRGAGNLLGGEQSGFIADVGFETYQRILNEALNELRMAGTLYEEEGDHAELKKSEVPMLPEVVDMSADIQIDTDFEIMFPDEYISSISERIRLYRELNDIKNETELSNFENKLIDRFGALPPQSQALLDIVVLKWNAAKLGMEKVIMKNGLFIAHFISDSRSPFYRTPLFVDMMNYINRHWKVMSMKQKENGLSLSVKNINSVGEAIKLCKQLQGN